MKKRLATVAALATAAVALAGCTGGSAPSDAGAADGDISGTITFQTWSLKNDTFTPYFENLIDAFEKKYPDTTVKWVDQPADGYEDKILQQAESGELPDVVNLPEGMAYSLAKAGQVLDLSQADPETLKDYVQGGVDAYTYDDIEGTYGFPWYLGTELNYWNTDLLQQGGVDAPPATLDEMFEDAGKLADAHIQTVSAIPSPMSLIAQSGPEDNSAAVFSDGKFTFNTPEAVAIVQKYADLYAKGGISPEALQGADTANSNINSFNKGSVAWTTAGPNYGSKDLAVNAPNLVDHVTATADFGNPPLYVQGVSVSKNSENTATALAFAEFLTNNDNQIEFVKLAAGFFPGTKAANEDPSAWAAESDVKLQNEATTLAAGQMDTAQILGPPQYTDDMDGYAKQQIALAVKGEISAQEALDNAVKYCDQNLES